MKAQEEPFGEQRQGQLEAVLAFVLMKGLEVVAGEYWQGKYEAALAFVHLKRQKKFAVTLERTLRSRTGLCMLERTKRTGW